MSMAESRSKQRWSKDPRGTTWSQGTNMRVYVACAAVSDVTFGVSPRATRTQVACVRQRRLCMARFDRHCHTSSQQQHTTNNNNNNKNTSLIGQSPALPLLPSPSSPPLSSPLPFLLFPFSLYIPFPGVRLCCCIRQEQVWLQDA